MSRESRMAILGRLKGKVRDAGPDRPVWTTRRQYADLPGRFVTSMQAAGGEVLLVDDWAAALDAVDGLLEDLGAARLVVNGDLAVGERDVTGRLSAYQTYVVGRDAGDGRAACAAADVGLSGADAALAESGTLVVSSGAAQARLATLLPPVHIALLPAAVITTDLFTWTAAREGASPAHVTLISGPSKTADIEMTLATGVHGPGRLITVLYND